MVVVDCCELCALRPREHACLVASSMAGWLAGVFTGHPAGPKARVGLFNSAFASNSSSSSRHQHHSTPTPHQAVLNRRHVWCPTILVSTFFFTPSFFPSTLRDDILEFCNANGSSLPLSGGGYETRCGLT